MATLASLKLTNARKPRIVSDVVKRRTKLLCKLTEQRELALAHSEGRTYAPQRLRSIRNKDTGERTVREMPVRIKAWWWTGEKGETLLSIQYGSKTLEIAKGKPAIEVARVGDLVNVLNVIIAAVQAGELDAQMEAASAKLRDGFSGKGK